MKTFERFFSFVGMLVCILLLAWIASRMIPAGTSFQDLSAKMAPVQPAYVQPVQPVQPAYVQPTAVPMQPVQPAYVQPTAVPMQPVQPASQVVHIEANGRTYDIPRDRLQACADAQDAGRRTSPDCPPNARQYLAGMAISNGSPAKGVYQSPLVYCLVGGGWQPEYVQALNAGFAMWQDAGVEFVQSLQGCTVPVSLYYDPASIYVGYASVGPGTMAAPGRLNINIALQPEQWGMAHEIGHILGLGHNDGSQNIMNSTGLLAAPSQADIATVRELWGLR